MGLRWPYTIISGACTIVMRMETFRLLHCSVLTMFELNDVRVVEI